MLAFHCGLSSVSLKSHEFEPFFMCLFANCIHSLAKHKHTFCPHILNVRLLIFVISVRIKLK